MPSSTAGTPNPTTRDARAGRPYDPRVRLLAAPRPSLTTAAAPNVSASPAAASAPTSGGPSIVRTSRAVATSTAESARAFATRQRGFDAERSRRSTRSRRVAGRTHAEREDRTQPAGKAERCEHGRAEERPAARERRDGHHDDRPVSEVGEDCGAEAEPVQEGRDVGREEGAPPVRHLPPQLRHRHAGPQ